MTCRLHKSELQYDLNNIPHCPLCRHERAQAESKIDARIVERLRRVFARERQEEINTTLSR
jgi:hypothetical protein